MEKDNHDKITLVLKNKQWFFLKLDGTRLSEESYDWAGDFHEGFARVEKNDQEFKINTKGERVNNLTNN